MRELTCDGCLELSAEVALGIADAEDRAAVLVHVDRCPGCRVELRSLSEVADGLAGLGPSAVAPLGFESRVVDAVTAAHRQAEGAPPASAHASPGAPRRAVRRRIFAAAAAVVTVAFGVGGWLLGAGSSRPPVSSAVVTAALVSGGRPVGEVMVSNGTEPWMSMAVHTTTNAVVECEVGGKTGGLTTLGAFTIAGGYGYWAAPLPRGATIRRARLVLASGRVLATAAIGTPG